MIKKEDISFCKTVLQILKTATENVRLWRQCFLWDTFMKVWWFNVHKLHLKTIKKTNITHCFWVIQVHKTTLECMLSIFFSSMFPTWSRASGLGSHALYCLLQKEQTCRTRWPEHRWDTCRTDVTQMHSLCRVSCWTITGTVPWSPSPFHKALRLPLQMKGQLSGSLEERLLFWQSLQDPHIRLPGWN